jgi:hypothetical protein
MEDRINNTRLSFACDQDWNNMRPESDGRFCSGCQKKVYDLRDKNVAYFVQIMEENNGNVCGHFSADQMMPPAPTYKPRWKTWLMAAVVSIGVGTISERASAQARTLGEPAPRVIEPDCEIYTLTGIVMPTGRINNDTIKQLQKYLFDQCILKNSVDGEFGVSFNSKNGKLTNVSVTGKLQKESGLKIINALKNGVKVINADLKGDHPYYINIVFKKGRVVSLKSL